VAVELDLPGSERIVVGDAAQVGHPAEPTAGARRTRERAMFAL
jgi:hypothetical protein